MPVLPGWKAVLNGHEKLHEDLREFSKKARSWDFPAIMVRKIEELELNRCREYHASGTPDRLSAVTVRRIRRIF